MHHARMIVSRVFGTIDELFFECELAEDGIL